MAGAKNQHANKTKGETEVRPEMFNAHCLRVKCRMWVALVAGVGGRRRSCTLARGVWAALQHPQWTVATFFCLFYFFSCFLFDFYFWCLHIFADQASQRQGALRACGRRLRLGEGKGKRGTGAGAVAGRGCGCALR